MIVRAETKPILKRVESIGREPIPIVVLNGDPAGGVVAEPTSMMLFGLGAIGLRACANHRGSRICSWFEHVLLYVGLRGGWRWLKT